MAFITLRQANVVNSPNATIKGSPLTNAEVDNNFANLNLTISGVANVVTNLNQAQISNGTSNINISVVGGDIEVSANFIPLTSNIINLGSDTRRFKDLFLAGNTINLGGDTISSVGGFIRVNNNNVFTTTGNIAGVDGGSINNLNASNITTGTLAVTQGGTGVATSTGTGSVVLSNSPTLVTPALGTPSSANIINAVSLPIVDGTTGTLSVARGGTGVTESTGSGNVVLSTSPVLTTPNIGTPSTANLLNAVGLPIVDGTTGTLSTARGGTGVTTATNGQLLVGNGSGFTANTITGTSNRITVNNGAGSITLTTPQDLHTTAQLQLGALGVGTGTFGSTGDIRATNNITAFFSSDNRYKENVRDIDNALEKVNHIGGKYFDWTDDYISAQGGADGYFMIKSDFGVIAQDVQEVFPVAVRERPDGSLAVDYEKLVSLAFAAIKELQVRVKKLEG